MAAKTWGEGWSRRGGGVAWDAITYDARTGLLFFGTGGSTPYNAMVRDPSGGDNLFLDSILAVRASTGEYVWHYQTVPHDTWDYDATMHIMVADLEIAGEKRSVVMTAPKNGFFYTLDALTGKLLSAEPIAKVSWASHVDLETGRPVEIPGARYHDKEGKVLVWPSVTGAHNWYAMGFDPRSGLVYLPATDLPGYFTRGEDGFGKYELYGSGHDVSTMGDDTGRLLAWDPVAGKARWTVIRERADNGGVLVTAGDLVFQGDTDGVIQAHDARDGKRLWSVWTGSSIQAAPVTYRSGDEQIVLVAAGRGGATGTIAPERGASTRARGPAKLLAFKLGGGELRVTEREFGPPPKPPEQRAGAKAIAKGADIYADHCSNCHGLYVRGIEVRMLGGAIPDLRYMPETAHAEFRAVVLGGIRLDRGMPRFADVLSVEQVDAVHAYVIEKAWEKHRKVAAR
jgi:glucose dehydrogenase